MSIKHKFFPLRIWSFCILALIGVFLYSPKACGYINFDPIPDEFGYSEGDIVPLVATFTDSVTGLDKSDYWAEIDWGDGPSEWVEVTIENGGKGFVSGAHIYGDNINAGVTVDILNVQWAMDMEHFTIWLMNVAPTVDIIVPDLTVDVGQAVNFLGNFTDPGWLDTFTGNWDFGDGTGPIGATLSYENNYPYATGIAQGMHTFFSCGTYEVFLTITDDDGGAGTDSLFVKVVPVPGAVLLCMLGLGIAGLKLRKFV